MKELGLGRDREFKNLFERGYGLIQQYLVLFNIHYFTIFKQDSTLTQKPRPGHGPRAGQRPAKARR